MTLYHAVMIDETGCEFGVDIRAANKDDAYEQLCEDYPESRVDSIESPQDIVNRERAMYARIEDEMNGIFWEDY